MGKNSSGHTHYLSLSGLEVYGQVTGVCEDLGKAAKEAEAILRKQRKVIKMQVSDNVFQVCYCCIKNFGAF